MTNGVKEKPDTVGVVFVHAGEALKAQLKVAAELSGMSQKAIVRSALETKMKAMARHLPKLRKLRKTLRSNGNGLSEMGL